MIKAVMFDMGGTLEDLYSDEKNDRATAYALYEILKKHGVEVPYEAEPLWDIVGKGIAAYKKESERTQIRSVTRDARRSSSSRASAIPMR